MLSETQRRILRALSEGAVIGQDETLRNRIIWPDGREEGFTLFDYNVLWNAGLIAFDLPRSGYTRRATLTPAGAEAAREGAE